MSIKKWIQRKVMSNLLDQSAHWKQPQIVWGYQNPSGAYQPHTRISDTAAIQYPERIRIGDHVYIGHYAVLDGTGGLTIEDGCQLGAGVSIFTHSSHIAIRLLGKHYVEVPEEKKSGFIARPVHIGKYSFIGAGSKIFAGASIGKGVFVKASAMVSQSVPDFAVVGCNGKVEGDTRDLDRPYLDDPEIAKWYREWQ